MKFLEKLARFYDLKRWEEDLSRREDQLREGPSKLKTDLKYVEDLLVEEASNPDITPEKQVEVRQMVRYITLKRAEERARLEQMFDAFRRSPTVIVNSKRES